MRQKPRPGSLPEIVVNERADRYSMLEALNQEVCRLYTVAGIRSDVNHMFAGVEFLEPTRVDGKPVVGARIGAKAFLAMEGGFLGAYHSLSTQLGV